MYNKNPGKSSLGKDGIVKLMIESNKPQNHKYHSVRQAARLLGQSVQTINNWIRGEKIAYLRVDNIVIIHHDTIMDVKMNGVEYSPKYTLDANHVTVNQAARMLKIEFQNLKHYVKKERIKNIKKDGIYFIPLSEVKYWLQVPEPRDPNKVEAYRFNAVLMGDAARTLKISASHCRALIVSGELKAIQGHCRRYVLNSSIAAYKGVVEAIDSL